MGLLDLASLEPDRAGHPVHRSELVDDGALDPRDRVRLELVTAARLELVQGVDEPEHAVADQVGLFDACGKPGGNAGGYVLHEGGVMQDEVIARRASALACEV